MPSVFLKKIPNPKEWNMEKDVEWASKLKVSTTALAYALKANNLIDSNIMDKIKTVKVPKEQKIDPELANTSSTKIMKRKEKLLKAGLNSHYVNKCITAYKSNLISANRMAEMLLTDEKGLANILSLFEAEIDYGD